MYMHWLHGLQDSSPDRYLIEPLLGIFGCYCFCPEYDAWCEDNCDGLRNVEVTKESNAAIT